MQTITFYSYKGGVGRTLAVANVAFYLAQFGQKVVAMDLDLEAPGLHYKLLPTAADQDATPVRGLVDYLHAFIDQGELPDHIEDYLVQVPLRPSIAGQVHLMPAGAVPSPDYWHKLARLNWHDLFYCDDAPGIPLFLEIKERIRAAYEPDFLLIDARTGITEIGGVATTVLPDQLVCLLLNNRENLEGARAVLRGIRNVPRPPGAASQVQVIPVLSRLPTREKPEDEQDAIRDVTEFLNAPAIRLEDTLELPEPFVLHTDGGIEWCERLLVASPDEREESTLLRDYMRLFARIIPSNVVQPQVGALIAQASDALLEDPDGAQRELENLARFSGRPEVYRRLLQVYRLRNVSGALVMTAAQRLWELTNNARDPLLWDIVKANFTTAYRSGAAARNSNMLRGSPNRYAADFLTFVEATWRAAGAENVKVATALAESFATRRQEKHGADLLLELSTHVKPEAKSIVQFIELLVKMKALDSAGLIIDRFADQYMDEPKFLSAWGKLILAQPGAEIPSHLTTSLEILALVSPDVALELATRIGDHDKTEKLALQCLDIALAGGPSGELEFVGRWCYKHGRGAEFDEQVRRHFSGDQAEDFLRYLRGPPPINPLFLPATRLREGIYQDS